MSMVDSASDARTANNSVRHQYRVLSDAEKAQMVAIKDKGAEFIALLDEMAPPPVQAGDDGMVIGQALLSRELWIARERIEEAVMWAVKAITA